MPLVVVQPQPPGKAPAVARGEGTRTATWLQTAKDAFFRRLGIMGWGEELWPFLQTLAVAVCSLPCDQLAALSHEHNHLSWERRMATTAVVRRRDGAALARVLRVMREDLAGVKAAVKEIKEASRQGGSGIGRVMGESSSSGRSRRRKC